MTKVVPIFFIDIDSVRVFITLMLDTIRKKKKKKKQYTDVGYNSEVLPRRSGSRVVPPSAAMAQTTSVVATATLISVSYTHLTLPTRFAV